MYAFIQEACTDPIPRAGLGPGTQHLHWQQGLRLVSLIPIQGTGGLIVCWTTLYTLVALSLHNHVH